MRNLLKWCFVLSLLIVSLGVLSVSAATEGIYTYTVANGEVEITDCNDSATGEIVIPATLGGYPVTKIGYGAFASLPNVESIVVPDGVKSLGAKSFNNSKLLQRVTLPHSLTLIDENAFSGCESLSAINIPEGITEISSNTFMGCGALTEIHLPDTLEVIGGTAFARSGLTEIILPNSVTKIDGGAFAYCLGLTSFTYNDEIQTIGESVFSGSENLVNIYVSENNALFSSIDGVLFSKDKTKLIYYPEGKSASTYTIPLFVTAIESRAFKQNQHLTEISIGNTVTSLGISAFYGCLSLTSVSLADSITTIPDFAFNTCVSLQNLVLGANTTTIGANAFSFCQSLSVIQLPFSVEAIGNGAFSYCTNLIKITISKKVTSIGLDAFHNCPNLTIYGIPGSYAETFALNNTIPFVVNTDVLLYLGDANCDQSVTAFDAVVILQIVAGIITADETQQISADVNEDGAITAFDAVLILRYIAGFSDDVPIGEILTVAPDYTPGVPVAIPSADYSTWGTTMNPQGYLVRVPALNMYLPDEGNVIVPIHTENNNPPTAFDSVNDRYDFRTYNDRLCTYSVDANSFFKIKKVLGESITGTDAKTSLASDDSTALYGFSAGYDGIYANVKLVKVTGTTYALQNPDGTRTDLLPNDMNYLTINSDSLIIIRSKNTSGSTIYTEYGIDNLPTFANTLTKFECVLVNNPNSTQTEYLAVFYGVVDGVLNNPAPNNYDNLVIIKTSGTIDVDASGHYHNYYDVYNPYTGQITINVQGYKSSLKASQLGAPAVIGNFYGMSNGVLDDTTASGFYGPAVFPASGTFTRTAETPTPPNLKEITGYENGVLTFKGDSTIYKTDSSTKVIMIEAGGTGKNDFKWGSASTKTLADLGSDSTSLRNYNVWENPDTGRITTIYADNIEAFVAIDSTKSVPGQYQVVDFVVILRDKVASVDYLNSNG